MDSDQPEEVYTNGHSNGVNGEHHRSSVDQQQQQQQPIDTVRKQNLFIGCSFFFMLVNI